MFLRSRLNSQGDGLPEAPPPVIKAPRGSGSDHADLKNRAHRMLIDTMREQGLDESSSPEAIRRIIREVLTSTLAESGRFVSKADQDRLAEEIDHEVTGLGPLEPLLQDPSNTEIMVNNPFQVYVEREGKIQLTDVRFQDERHLMRIIDRIVSRVGRRIDESSPMCDARLPDGSRINAIIPPLAIDGPALTIRRFQRGALSIRQLVALQTLSRPMADFLKACIEAKLNVLISGGTGTGKTTMLNALSAFIPPGERLITIEDAAELQLQQSHVIRLETRTSNVEGAGRIDQAELIRNCLRMRPDRIILGEVRGAEALGLLQAMNTGHEGSLTTIHANSPRDALARLETMVLLAGAGLPLRAVREQISSAIDVLLQVERSGDGRRRVTGITELVGMEADHLLSQELFVFEREGVDAQGRTLGHHRATGLRPRCLQQITRHGIVLPIEIFDEGAP